MLWHNSSHGICLARRKRAIHIEQMIMFIDVSPMDERGNAVVCNKNQSGAMLSITINQIHHPSIPILCKYHRLSWESF